MTDTFLPTLSFSAFSRSGLPALAPTPGGRATATTTGGAFGLTGGATASTGDGGMLASSAALTNTLLVGSGIFQ